MVLDSSFYLGDKRFKDIDLNNYNFKLYDSFNPKFQIPHDKIMFHQDYTEKGLFLTYQKDLVQNNNNSGNFNSNNLDNLEGLEKYLAVLGFNINNDSYDCLQIQGSKGSFKYLSPISWDRALLNNLIEYSKKEKGKRVTLIPWYYVKGDETIMRRDNLEKRYDLNAKLSGFKFSETERLYIKENS